MPRRRPRTRLPVILIALLAMLCTGLALAAARIDSIGDPSSQLNPLERTFLSGYLAIRADRLQAPAASDDRVVSLDVEPGQSAAEVAGLLSDLGVLDEPSLFLRYLRYRGLDTGIQAGRYRVDGSLSLVSLADLLQEARDSRYTLTIVEGHRREEVAQRVASLGIGISAGDFLAATRRPPPRWTDPPASASDLEGFLYPDTYRLDPSMDAVDVVELVLETLEARLSPELRSGFADQGLTSFQAVVLASVVERESAIADERPIIASVFLNRLAAGIPLQADPTVQYALGLQPDGSWWKPALSAEDLLVESPFNTYRVPGLPAGPIANPGFDSLSAVARPARTGYLFFRAACDESGRHVFASTFEEHLLNACP